MFLPETQLLGLKYFANVHIIYLTALSCFSDLPGPHFTQTLEELGKLFIGQTATFIFVITGHQDGGLLWREVELLAEDGVSLLRTDHSIAVLVKLLELHSNTSEAGGQGAEILMSVKRHYQKEGEQEGKKEQGETSRGGEKQEGERSRRGRSRSRRTE